MANPTMQEPSTSIDQPNRVSQVPATTKDESSADRTHDATLAAALENIRIAGSADSSQADSNNIPPHLSHDPTNNAKRTDPFQFGQRYLSTSDDPFEYNAWDHVAPDEEYLAHTETQYAMQRASPVSEWDKNRFNANPEKWWDLFYKQKTSTFFKDRKWLFQEFPVLAEVTKPGAGAKTVLEVGAGAGNTAFPIMRLNENDQLNVVAADFSSRAVQTMREADEITGANDVKVKGRVRAEVWDAAGDGLPEGLDESSVDVVVMIFIFSALEPRQWEQAVRNVWKVLRPGGEVLFRDYGRGDLAQVRFKKGRYLEENFYVRGDGTRVYFFERDELERIWSKDVESAQFEVVNLDVDRRLIVNRSSRVKMFRCWMQGRFRKPS